MKKYTIEVTEVLSRIIETDTENEDAAARWWYVYRHEVLSENNE